MSHWTRTPPPHHHPPHHPTPPHKVLLRFQSWLSDRLDTVVPYNPPGVPTHFLQVSVTPHILGHPFDISWGFSFLLALQMTSGDRILNSASFFSHKQNSARRERSSVWIGLKRWPGPRWRWRSRTRSTSQSSWRMVLSSASMLRQCSQHLI